MLKLIQENAIVTVHTRWESRNKRATAYVIVIHEGRTLFLS